MMDDVTSKILPKLESRESISSSLVAAILFHFSNILKLKIFIYK